MSENLKIVIVGGVAGGATAAARARRLSESAEIVVFERGPFVSFANCGLPYHVGGEIADRSKLVLQTPESLRSRHRLDVRVRSEVVAINRAAKTVTVRALDENRTYDEPYDKLILSTGAAPLRPPLPGIDHPRIFTLRNIPDMDRIVTAAQGAAVALVIGGGFIGLEMAENLRRRGLQVDLVELLDQIMPPMDREMTQPVARALVQNGVRLHLSDAVESFGDAGGRVRAQLKSGQTLTADLAVLAIGVRPESALAKDAGLALGERGGVVVNEHMQTSDPDIYAVGDSVVVKDWVTGADTLIPLAGPANRQGRIAADHIFGRASWYRGSQGTSIVRVFDRVAAMTGASEKSLKRAGRPYRKVYLHPAHHVGYFPGAQQMSIKLLFAPDDGRVLGAQIVGGEGVDKRIDVLAAALQARMTVYDLEEMELAYAPQFGAAKDPINMAGFIAANVLRGDVATCHVDDAPKDGAVWLDVRTAAEHAAGAIPGSILVPIDELRDRLGELPNDRPIVTYCAVGQRGYTAARILKQLGFDARNLSGGYRTWSMFQPVETNAAPGESNAPVSCSGPAPCGAGALHSEPVGSAGTAAFAPKVDGPAVAAAELDVRGQQCPGPIVAICDQLASLGEGAVLKVRASDPGFVSDVPAWCRQSGHELIDVHRENGHYVALIRKHASDRASAPVDSPKQAVRPASAAQNKTIVVFSGDLDRVMAAFIIANGAASMGQSVTLFFTFWGLNVLRRSDPPATTKAFMDRMFGWMMPRGPDKLALSKMHMAGLGTAMMRRTMQRKHVAPLQELMRTARRQGVRFVACSMSMDVMGIGREELIDGVEIGGVGAYLDAAATANVNLFI
ncbi:MAG: pyridine nucleotide-disulfide oxidoreductase [Phycisphaerae bacterium]|nr:MAG: FAD-dependent oxidoreductase [Planctomycetia bacterium]RIK66374.1 MAG: pyridine nucleotide-disulfide oxidoreductase [Planctomycetota bacterium]GJQ25133.1 MAG: pyridine nucleotide-disulfide oxidoreductase [Phycisphaerae bacterium]